MGKKTKKVDALTELQGWAADGAADYETVSKDKTLRKVKADAVAGAGALASLAAGSFDEPLAQKEKLEAAAKRIEAAVEAREEKLLGPDDAFPDVPGIHSSIITNLLTDCRKILGARKRAKTTKPTGKLRSEDDFWALIEKVKRKAKGDLDVACESFTANLRLLDNPSLIKASRLFSKAMQLAYRWDVWGAAYVIHGGCSDDAFWDFRAGLIALGRTRFERALAERESLAAIADIESLTFFEGFQYCPDEVIKERELDVEGTPHSKPKPAGRAWKEEALAKKFPRLSKRFG